MTATLTQRITPVLAALALAACAPAATVNQQSEEAAIRSIGQDWQRAIAARDVDRIASFFAPDVVIMNPNTPLVTGAAAARAAWASMVGMPGLSLTWTPTQIEVTGPATATETGTYSMAFNSPGGRVNDAGGYITHWRKIDGRWLVARDAVISTTPMAMGDPMAAMGVDTMSMEMRPNSSLTWTDMVVPGFAPGVKRAVLHGNPAAAGDYVMRLQFPDGYQVPVHWHSKAEHLTVLSGTFNIGMGGTHDANLMRAYSPGDFVYMPARIPHFASVRGATTVQLHGLGPFQLNLGTP